MHTLRQVLLLSLILLILNTCASVPPVLSMINGAGHQQFFLRPTTLHSSPHAIELDITIIKPLHADGTITSRFFVISPHIHQLRPQGAPQLRLVHDNGTSLTSQALVMFYELEKQRIRYSVELPYQDFLNSTTPGNITIELVYPQQIITFTLNRKLIQRIFQLRLNL
jgi:hypothetical protein